MIRKIKKDLRDVIKKGINELTNKVDPSLRHSSTYDSANVSARVFIKETFQVVGTDYYINNMNKLRIINPEYRKRQLPVMRRIYKYTYVDRPVKLIFEPQNPHDNNAIKVFVAGEHVGYISRNDNIHVGEILRYHEIKYLYASFKGGAYKVMTEANEIVKAETQPRIDLYIGYISGCSARQ